MQITERSGSIDDYHYGFNGKEKDDEIKGGGNSYDFGARMYDPRLGRWFATDVFERYYAYLSPYSSFNNNPLRYIDPDGRSLVSVLGDPPNFKLGKNLKPQFTYDNGHSDFPKVNPTIGDNVNEFGWGVLTGIVTILRPDMGNAISAYKHFQNGKGKDYTFDFEDYINSDSSGKQMRENAIILTKGGAEALLKNTGSISISSIGMSANEKIWRFPYPDTSCKFQ